MAVFWDVTPHSLLDNDRRFRVAYCLRHQGLLIAVMMETVSLKCRSQGEIFHKTATFFFWMVSLLQVTWLRFVTKRKSRDSIFVHSVYSGEPFFSAVILTSMFYWINIWFLPYIFVRSYLWSVTMVNIYNYHSGNNISYDCTFIQPISNSIGTQ
jgi:hypothetical protein